jgi:hypothetical protein
MSKLYTCILTHIFLKPSYMTSGFLSQSCSRLSPSSNFTLLFLTSSLCWPSFLLIPSCCSSLPSTQANLIFCSYLFYAHLVFVSFQHNGSLQMSSPYISKAFRNISCRFLSIFWAHSCFFDNDPLISII